MGRYCRWSRVRDAIGWRKTQIHFYTSGVLRRKILVLCRRRFRHMRRKIHDEAHTQNEKAILRRRRTRLLVDAQNLNVRSRWTQKLFCVGGPACIESIYDYGCKKYLRFVSWGPASIKNGCKNYFDWVLWRRKMPRASFSRLLGIGLVSFGTFAFRPLFFRALVVFVVQLSWSRVQDRSGRELYHRRRSSGTVYAHSLVLFWSIWQ